MKACLGNFGRDVHAGSRPRQEGVILIYPHRCIWKEAKLHGLRIQRASGILLFSFFDSFPLRVKMSGWAWWLKRWTATQATP